MTVQEIRDLISRNLSRDYYTHKVRGISHCAELIMKYQFGDNYLYDVKNWKEIKDGIYSLIYRNTSGDYYSGKVRGDKDDIANKIFILINS